MRCFRSPPSSGLCVPLLHDLHRVRRIYETAAKIHKFFCFASATMLINVESRHRRAADVDDVYDGGGGRRLENFETICVTKNKFANLS